MNSKAAKTEQLVPYGTGQQSSQCHRHPVSHVHVRQTTLKRRQQQSSKPHTHTHTHRERERERDLLPSFPPARWWWKWWWWRCYMICAIEGLFGWLTDWTDDGRAFVHQSIKTMTMTMTVTVMVMTTTTTTRRRRRRNIYQRQQQQQQQQRQQQQQPTVGGAGGGSGVCQCSLPTSSSISRLVERDLLRNTSHPNSVIGCVMFKSSCYGSTVKKQRTQTHTHTHTNTLHSLPKKKQPNRTKLQCNNFIRAFILFWTTNDVTWVPVTHLIICRHKLFGAMRKKKKTSNHPNRKQQHWFSSTFRIIATQ